MKQPPLLAGCWSSRQATAAVRRAGSVLPESTMKASPRRRRPALDLCWPDDPAAYWTDGVVRQSAALRRGIRTRATLRHELIKLDFVLRHPKANEKVLKLPLLLFEAPESFLTIFVKGPIAARS